MATPIITPAIIRRRLIFGLGDVASPCSRTVLCGGSAANAHRLDIVEGEGSWPPETSQAAAASSNVPQA